MQHGHAMQTVTERIGGKYPVTAVAAGHEYRQDDWPAIAIGPDGSTWVTWLSFAGDRDDIGLRRYQNGKWGNLQWVPATSGDNMMPQVAVDSANRVWIVWSQQVEGNWDIYARRYDVSRQQWDAAVRLTSDPLPDLHPRMWTDRNGHGAVVWQGFRGGTSNIFLSTLGTDGWSSPIRITNHRANDWEPAVAMDASGSAWVAYDSYQNGNYDVFLRRVQGTNVGPEIGVAVTPRFEVRPTLTIDENGRVWVAWESGLPNWGKDYAFIIKDKTIGAMEGGAREVRVRCYANGRWLEAAKPLSSALPQDPAFQPQVLPDGHGSVWLLAKLRRTLGEQRGDRNTMGYYEYWATHWDGESWSPAVPWPHSRGRLSTRIQSSLAADGNLWVAWSTDNRTDRYSHRPVREQIYVGLLDQSAIADKAQSLQDATDEPVSAPVAHPHEALDVRAIRGYTALVDGKQAHILRGDLHRHTELSWDGGGRQDGTLLDFYRYMIDAAAMDFGASTDHQGGSWPYWWYYTQKMTDMFHLPGTYVSLFGFERSIPFPNGHRNIFYATRRESRVLPFNLKAGAFTGLPEPPQGDEPGTTTPEIAGNDTKLVYEELRMRNGISIPHTSGTNQGTDWRDNDPNLEPVVEIFQGARCSYEAVGAPHVVPNSDGSPEFPPEWVKVHGHQPSGMVVNAWAKGYRLGVIASSDHYSTHVSYAMVYTADPTRRGVLDAIRRRHTYGAMDNIILDVRMGSHFMGDVFSLRSAVPITVKARGTRNVARVSVIRDANVIYTTEPNRQDVEFKYLDHDSLKGPHYYYVRIEQDNTLLAWSSPMFVDYQ
jgi:hypothetical protein